MCAPAAGGGGDDDCGCNGGAEVLAGVAPVLVENTERRRYRTASVVLDGGRVGNDVLFSSPYGLAGVRASLLYTG